MSGRAYTRPMSSAEQFRDHTDFLRWEIVPDERVGPPPRAPRRWPRWLAVATLALAGGGWAMVDDKPAAVAWLSDQTSTAISWSKTLTEGIARLGFGTSHAAPPALPKLSLFDERLVREAVPRQLPEREVVQEKIAVAPEPETAETKTAPEEPSSEAGPATEKPAPLPPLPPLTDPLQKKAEAVGLHPELSRAVLESFSAADFKNAGIAIKKAIAETPDDAVLIWPATPRRGMARFRIHFVPGVSPACRRYVVGVAKSGWLTTALPMERCGVKPRLARSHRSAREPEPVAAHP